MDRNTLHKNIRWLAHVVSLFVFIIGAATYDMASFITNYWHWKTGSQVIWKGLMINVPENYVVLNSDNSIQEGILLSNMQSPDDISIWFSYDPLLYNEETLQFYESAYGDSLKKLPCSISNFKCQRYEYDSTIGRDKHFDLIIPDKNVNIYYFSNFEQNINFQEMISKAH